MRKRLKNRDPFKYRFVTMETLVESGNFKHLSGVDNMVYLSLMMRMDGTRAGSR